jgi:hypothetical protein
MSTQVHKDDPEQVQAQVDQRQQQGTSRAHSPASNPSVQTQIAFAQSAFANIQDLNRTMDAKANYLLSSVALLTAALGHVASSAVTVTAQADWQRVLKGAGIVLMLLYLLVAFAVIAVATNIYRARSQRVAAASTPPGMLFPLMILKRYSVDDNPDETAYLNRLETLRAEDILQDYSNQIMEVSIIYEAKQRQVNLGLALFRWTGVLWLLTMLVVVMIIILIP